MKSSELVGYLKANASIGTLKKRIAPFINEFSDGLQVKGGSAPIILTIENKDVHMRSDKIRRLCLGYLDGTLNATEIEYVASAFDICPDFKFETDDLRELTRELSDLHAMDMSEVVEFVKTTIQHCLAVATAYISSFPKMFDEKLSVLLVGSEGLRDIATYGMVSRSTNRLSVGTEHDSDLVPSVGSHDQPIPHIFRVVGRRPAV